jgi:hypothetical protein
MILFNSFLKKLLNYYIMHTFCHFFIVGKEKEK